MVTEIRLQGNDALELLLGQNALGQAVGHLRAGDGSAHVIYKVSNAVAEGEEALHGAELAAAGGRGQALRFEVIGPVLQIAEAHVAQREVDEVDELKEVALVGFLCVWGFAVEPELDEVFVVVGLGWDALRRNALRSHVRCCTVLWRFGALGFLSWRRQLVSGFRLVRVFSVVAGAAVGVGWHGRRVGVGVYLEAVEAHI